MSIAQNTVTLAVLAGGEGSRMGRPKGELSIRGQPLLAFLLDRLKWPGPTLLVTTPGREHPPAFEYFDAEAVDPISGHGPLRGILTALENSQTEFVAVTTVDMPAITTQQLNWVLNGLLDQPAKKAIMCRRRADGVDIVEPFPSIYRRCFAPVIAERLKSSRRSVQDLAGDPVVAVVSAPNDWPADVWTNLNSPSDLQTFLRRL